MPPRPAPVVLYPHHTCWVLVSISYLLSLGTSLTLIRSWNPFTPSGVLVPTSYLLGHGTTLTLAWVGAAELLLEWVWPVLEVLRVWEAEY